MRTLALIAFACGAGTGASSRTVCAQATASIEAGVSDVRYDGFLASAAASISPTLRWEHPRGRGFLSARGTYLRFESGNRSLDGSAAGSWFTPLARHWRGEVGVAAGASDYAKFASFNHGVAEARLHLIDGDRGGWFGATLGRSSFGSGPRPVTVLAMGVWLLRADRTFFVSLDRSFVGDTAYTDFRSAARWPGAGIALEGSSHKAEKVRVVGNTQNGLTLDGAGFAVQELQASSNGNRGIHCFGGSGHSVRNSQVVQNGGPGIDLSECPGSAIIGTNVSGNGGAGIVAKCPSHARLATSPSAARI